ncbi:hypothetical protein FMM74_016420 [Lachnospiraceae bacterium MD308]|nr:hypothetical protein [Lachnospiraceae bacterium MD308]
MKKVLSCLLAVILSAIGLAGCGAGGNAGGEDVAEEFLTFYTTVSDEDKNFILSLAEIKK